MTILYIAAGIVVLLVAFYFFGVYISAQERKNAPENLNKAERLMEKKEQLEAVRMLEKAFYVPLDEKYEKEDAKTAYRAVVLLEKIMGDMGMEKVKFVTDLKDALQNASLSGGEVPESLTGPVEDFLGSFSGDVNTAANALMAMAEGKEVQIKETVKDFTDLLEADEVKHINVVGKMLMKGKVEEAADYLNEQLENPDISQPLYATLLEQRAGCFFMMKKYELAAEGYQSVLNYYPGNKRVLESLKDTKKKL